MDEDDELTHPQAEPPPPLSADEAEVRQFFQMISYQAPLPPPDMLAAYERILPGAAKRIFDRMERQADHRQWAEKVKLEADIMAQKKGQYFAFIMGLIGLIGGFGLIWIGSSAIGLSIFISTLAAFVAVFIVGKSKQGKALERQLSEFRQMLPRGLESPKMRPSIEPAESERAD